MLVETLMIITDVSLNAKIRILKQITTFTLIRNLRSLMLVSMQRYEF